MAENHWSKDFKVGCLCLVIAGFLGIIAYHLNSISKKETPQEESAKSSQPSNIRYIDGSSRVGCNTEVDLDKAIQFAHDQDRAALWHLMYFDHACFPLDEGDIVYIENSTWSGKVKIRPRGSSQEIWTLLNALTSNAPKINSTPAVVQEQKTQSESLSHEAIKESPEPGLIPPATKSSKIPQTQNQHTHHMKASVNKDMVSTSSSSNIKRPSAAEIVQQLRNQNKN
jgi:hypothetical protein